MTKLRLYSSFVYKKFTATCVYDSNDKEIREQFVSSCLDTKLREFFLRIPGLTIEQISELGLLGRVKSSSKRNR